MRQPQKKKIIYYSIIVPWWWQFLHEWLSFIRIWAYLMLKTVQSTAVVRTHGTGNWLDYKCWKWVDLRLFDLKGFCHNTAIVYPVQCRSPFRKIFCGLKMSWYLSYFIFLIIRCNMNKLTLERLNSKAQMLEIGSNFTWEV